MKAAYKYFTYQARTAALPHLSNTLTTPYGYDLDPEIELVLLTGRAKDPTAARELMERYGAKTAWELLSRLPPPPKPDWRARLRAAFARMEGSYTTDPHSEELRKWKRKLKDLHAGKF